MRFSPRVLLGYALVGLVCAEVVDFGDLKDYQKSGDNPSDLPSDSIRVKKEDNGFRVMFGQDVESKVAGIVDGCANLDNACFQDIVNALDDTHVQQDQALESRQVAVALRVFSMTWRTMKKFKEAIAAATLAFKAYKSGAGSNAMYWPEVAASSFGAMPTDAKITLSAGGSAVGTMTSTPETTSLDHASPPAITPGPNGDLVALLDKDLASRLNDFMEIHKNCRMGQDYDKEHPTRRRDAKGTMGQALCGASATLENTKGGFSDLLMIDFKDIHFTLNGGVAKVKEAADAYAVLVKEYAPLLAVPEEFGNQVATYILALAIDKFIDGVALGEKNSIKASSIDRDDTEEETTSTSDGCPQPTDLPCGRANEKCGAKIKEEDGKREMVCKDGDHEDCKCDAPRLTFVNEISYDYFQSVLGSAKDEPVDVKCPVVMTSLPWKVFDQEDDGKMKIVKDFCNNWNKDSERELKVNIDGQEQKRRKRTPPANPDAYKEWQVKFNYKPSDNGGSCKRDCNGAIREMTDACISNAVGLYMYEKSELDVGCGTFNWEIIAPKKEEVEQPQAEKPKPNCPDQQSTLPAQVFWEKDGNRMFNPFCHAWQSGTSSEMIVNTRGEITQINETPPSNVPPPPDMDSANFDQVPDWRVRFIFNKKDGECSMTCDEAYESMGQTCRASQDGKGGGQYRQGSIDVGCGTFLYHAYKLNTDRKGSSRCGHNIGSEQWGNESADKLEDSKLYTSGTDDNGTCRVNSAGYGMSTFVQTFTKDKKCELFGYEMKHYRAVLKATGSAVCGSLHYDNDCMFTTNFISHGCKNK